MGLKIKADNTKAHGIAHMSNYFKAKKIYRKEVDRAKQEANISALNKANI